MRASKPREAGAVLTSGWMGDMSRTVFGECQRLVVKVGSSSLTRSEGGLDEEKVVLKDRLKSIVFFLILAKSQCLYPIL